jgi:hypothetical protein
MFDPCSGLRRLSRSLNRRRSRAEQQAQLFERDEGQWKGEISLSLDRNLDGKLRRQRRG